MLVTGDFNTQAGSESYNIINSSALLRDSYYHSNSSHYGGPNSFNAFKHAWPPDNREQEERWEASNKFAMDHVFVTKGVDVLSHAYVYDEATNGHQISDHYAVMVVVCLA